MTYMIGPPTYLSIISTTLAFPIIFAPYVYDCFGMIPELINLAFFFSPSRCGWENAVTGQTARLRDYRKRLFEVLGTKAKSAKFNGLQDSEVHRFLLRTLEDPGHMLEHVRT